MGYVPQQGGLIPHWTAFLESTYGAAADLAVWDRADFDRPAGYTPYQPAG